MFQKVDKCLKYAKSCKQKPPQVNRTLSDEEIKWKVVLFKAQYNI